MEKINTTPEKGDASSVSKLPHSGKILKILLLCLIVGLILAWLFQDGLPAIHIFGSTMPSSIMGAFLLTFNHILV